MTNNLPSLCDLRTRHLRVRRMIPCCSRVFWVVLRNTGGGCFVRGTPLGRNAPSRRKLRSIVGAADLLLRLLALGLLREEHGVDVREHAARGDGDAAEELVQLLVVAHGELEVARHDARLLVVARRVAGELEDLGAEVLEDRGEVHGRAGADARAVLALLEVAADAADGELEARLGGPGRGLLAARLALAAAALALARHGVEVCGETGV
mmetsp:Transcript_8361/g.29537  ORF Transcript_8361/g.29537 Transcript_8361/m.29537 type:complete len:209 (-) Transcript_8361:48-674(-)